MAGQIGRQIGRQLVFTVSGLSVGYCTMQYFVGFGKCEDISMYPSLQDGDLVVLTPFSVSYKKVQKGDIVFCRSPKNCGSVICKRVIGMEGDFVHNADTGGKEYISKGQIWLEGDNKDYSVDSRDFGQVPYGLLLSKVALRIWPLSRMGILKMYQEDDFILDGEPNIEL